jgi:hypothetical protein
VVYAGWKNPPVLIDDIPGAGAAHTFQDVQLSPHTIIHATAPICPGWKNSVTEALFLYNQNYHVQLTGANLPTVVKWFIYGPVDQ